MSLLEQFMKYANDFERTFRDDDWSRLEGYFAPDATYTVTNVPFACRIEGRDAILRGIRKSLDNFDRKFPGRAIDLPAPPSESGDSVTFPWAVTYTKEGFAPLTIRGRSTARYRGDRIVALQDDFEDGVSEATERWTRENDLPIDPSYT